MYTIKGIIMCDLLDVAWYYQNKHGVNTNKTAGSPSYKYLYIKQ